MVEISGYVINTYHLPDWRGEFLRPANPQDEVVVTRRIVGTLLNG